jgi:anthranilate phosphoribosyltransferase
MSKDNHNSIASSSCQAWLRKLVAQENLTQKEAALLMRELVSETVSDTLKAALLTALAIKRETIDEITGMAREMRAQSIKVPAKNPLLDTCGTGGSGLTRLNVSTASAFILASCGACVAKHGNRAASGRVGSFDVLEALGAKVELTPKQVAKTIQKTNLGFMFAPLYHPAMKNIMPVRKELSIRTVFNILGPLTNPAQAQYQILGVSNEKLGVQMITVLKKLGCKRALVVYGEDGLDEITITAPTKIWELKNNTIHKCKISPEQFDIQRAQFSKIKGGNAAQNARVIRGVLKGTITGAQRDIILLNAGAGLYVYGTTPSIKKGIELAREAVITGKAKVKLAEYINASNVV